MKLTPLTTSTIVYLLIYKFLFNAGVSESEISE